MRFGWLVLFAAGCGRFSFEIEQTRDDAATDAATDATAARYARAVTEDVPIAYWQFETAPLVVDATNRGHDGTLAGGVARGAGIVGGGVVLSAGGDFRDDGGTLSAPASDFLFDGNAPFTLECWVLPTRLAGHWTQLFQTDNFDSQARRNGYTIEYLDDHVHVIRRRDGIEEEAVARDVMVTGRWIHLAGTYDGASLRMYVDGTVRDTQPSPLAMQSEAGTPFSISDGEYTLTGPLDECAIYDRALSDERIAEHHAAALGL